MIDITKTKLLSSIKFSAIQTGGFFGEISNSDEQKTLWEVDLGSDQVLLAKTKATMSWVERSELWKYFMVFDTGWQERSTVRAEVSLQKLM